MTTGRYTAPILALLAVTASLMLGACEDPEADRAEIEEALSGAFTDAAGRAPLDYEVLQAEFQAGSDGTNAWVVQMDDPAKAVATTPDAATFDAIFTWPLQIYRDAIESHLDQLGFVDTYILAFRDQCDTVYEISPRLLTDYADRSITDDEIVDQMTITGTC